MYIYILLRKRLYLIKSLINGHGKTNGPLDIDTYRVGIDIFGDTQTSRE